MKNFTKLALVVAVSAASIPAFALTPAQITSARSAGSLVQVDISGASAQNQVLQDVMAAICDTNADISHYRDVESAASPGKRFNSFACKISGVNVLISNQSPGSIEGIVPVMNLEPVEFMNVEASNCTITTPVGSVQQYNCSVSVPSTKRTTRWYCNGTDTGTNTAVYATKQTRCSVPIAGVSDVEPSNFEYDVNADGGSLLNTSSLSHANLFIQPFAPVINQVFAAALIAEGKVTPVQPNGHRYPILSKAFIRSAFAKSSKVRASDAAPSLGVPANGTVDAEYAAFEQSGLTVCRRTLGSGTHVAQNLFYMASPCKAPVTGDVAFADGGAMYNAANLGDLGSPYSSDQHITLEAGGSSDMELCYERAQSGGVADAINAGGVTWVTPGIALPAIGYQSFGNKQTGAGEGKAGQWQFVATDGVAPTMLNAANGFHTNYWEASINWKTGRPSAAQQSVINKLVTAGNSTAAISASKAGAKILAVAGADLTPKTKGTLANSGLRIRYARGNSCAEPLPNGQNPANNNVYPSAGLPLNANGSPQLIKDSDMY